MDTDLNIPDVELLEDFSIIFKGVESEKRDQKLYEIKTSKDELMRKLRYFKRRIIELNYTNEIYIHEEDISYEDFKEFIDSILNKKIKINEHNYLSIYKLSKKYEYHELQKQVENFIQTRPDLKKIIFQFSHQNSIDDRNQNSEDTYKEELIAKNIDLCIQNGYLSQIPIPILFRILNSPQKVIKNHNFLFKFVMETIKKYNNESYSKEEKEIAQMLPSCLNYLEMTSDEINELFSITKLSSAIFAPQNSNEMIKTLVKEIDEMKKKTHMMNSQFSEMKQKIESNDELNEKNQNEIKNKFLELAEINNKQKSYINVLEQKIVKNQQELDLLTEKIQQQDEIMHKYESLNQNLIQINEKYEQNIKEINAKIQQHDETINKYESLNQNLIQINEKYEQKIKEIASKIQQHDESINKYESLYPKNEQKAHEKTVEKQHTEDFSNLKKIDLSYKPNNEFNGIIEYLRKKQEEM